MLIEFDRFTGEVSEVAVCAAAEPTVTSRAAAVTAVTSAPMRDLRRRGSRGENNAVRILLLKDGGSSSIPSVGTDHARPAERRRSSL
jgi:hypothetical protein